MTKKNELIWRLHELPDATQVSDLVANDVITKEEARDILFKTEERDKDTEIKSLKEQIAFMQHVVDNLSRNNHSNVTYTPKYPTSYWTANANTSSIGNVVTYTLV